MQIRVHLSRAFTAPVREAIRSGENGWLVDFFDGKALVERMLYALSAPPEAAGFLRDAIASHQ
ncbi:MAG: hypothetical protein LBU45_07615 [Azoarcus sp.]|nr:hypothetical protein [Azoarcus sp.]